MRKAIMIAALTSVTGIQSGMAGAQDTGAASGAPATQIEDIVVTAQRKSERLQDVPIAITAISSSRLGAAGVDNAAEITTLAPALNVSVNQAYFQPRIRGVGTQAFGAGIENPIATYIDGVYLAAANVTLLSLSDVERIEVLKGPQGTLFGRNATGGLIQIITRDPKPGFGGSAEVGYGNYDRITAEASLYGGNDIVSGIATGFYRRQGDGYGTNLFLGKDANRPAREYGGRAKLLVNAGDRTTIRVSGDYVHSAGNYPDLRPPKGEPLVFGPTVPGSVWNTSHDLDTYTRYSGGGASLTIEHEFDAVRVLSISAYRKSKFNYTIDYDLTPNPFLSIFNVQKDSQYSQELQISSAKGSKVDWIIGGYYFHAKGGFFPSTIAFGGPTIGIPPVTQIDINGDQRSTSWAGFGQVTVPLGENTRLTGGLRYTTERRAQDATTALTILGAPGPLILPSSSRATFNKLTFRASIDQKLTPDTLLYASFNRGFKSGGFNILTPDEASYRPEVLDAYEVGLKADLFDHKLRFNPAFFYYDYTNIQLPFFTSAGLVGIANGPSAKLYGADLDLEFVPAENLRIFAGASYVHNRFGRYPDAVVNTPLGGGAYAPSLGDATGNNLPFTAKFSGNVGFEYKVETDAGNVLLNANYYYNDGFRVEVDNRARQKSFDQLSASIGWESNDGALNVRVWSKNLTNSKIYTQFATAPQGVGTSYQPPRTYGITAGTKF